MLMIILRYDNRSYQFGLNVTYCICDLCWVKTCYNVGFVGWIDSQKL